MSNPLNDALTELRREYLFDAPGRLAELRKDVAAFRAGESDAVLSLIRRFHKLAGSGGSYGFPEISDLARGGERWLKTEPPIPGEPAAVRLDELVDRGSGGAPFPFSDRVLATVVGGERFREISLRTVE